MEPEQIKIKSATIDVKTKVASFIIEVEDEFAEELQVKLCTHTLPEISHEIPPLRETP